MDITAAVTPSAGGGFEVQQVQIDGPREDEVLVRVHAAGVCHTDLICADGAFPAPMPGVFGHEGAGVIEEIGFSVVTSTSRTSEVMGTRKSMIFVPLLDLKSLSRIRRWMVAGTSDRRHQMPWL